MNCPKCNKSLAQNETSCSGCGAPVIGPGTAVTVVAAEQQTRVASAEPRIDSFDAPQPGARLGDRYEIVSVLGIGGMGIVYRAHDLKLERDVALKLIRPDLLQSESVAERFRREILLSSQITHKNILRVHDLVESDGLSYISMQFVEGETLQDLLERDGPLPAERAVALAIQLTEAMSAAHDAGVIHRDLKPQNILLDKQGTAYIADFGISRSLASGETMTQQGAILGTVDYMSPEQARGESTDHRSDVYSMAMVFYRMLTGALPFDNGGLSSIQAMLRRVQEEVPPIQTLRPDLPPWLAAVVTRALRRDPGDRYQSMGEMREDLEQHTATVTWHQVLKPKLVLPVAAIVLVVLVAVAALYLAPRFLSPDAGDADPLATLALPQASLILLPFQNGTGDTSYDWIGGGLPDLLRTDLMQSAALRLVEGERVKEIYDGLKLPETRDPPPETMYRMAGLLGADSLLTATLHKAGNRFRIEATLQTVVGEAVTAGAPIQVEGDGEDSIFAMVDQLSTKLRGELGVLERSGERGVTELSTDSVEALRLYSEALVSAKTGNHLEATRQFEAALVVAPEFAMARAQLADSYSQLGRAEDAAASIAVAAQNVQRLSPYEAARVQATQARLSNDLEAAEASYTQLSAIAPNSAEVFYGLATVQEQQGNLDGALQSIQRVLELDPRHADAQYARGRLYAKSGNLPDALMEFNASLASHVLTGNDEGRAQALNGLGNIYLFLDELDEALDHYQKSLVIRERLGDRFGVSAALSNISLIHKSQGRYDEAVDSTNQSLEILRESGDQGALAKAHSSLGDLYQEMGKPKQALAAYQESMRLLRDLGDDEALAWTLSSLGYVNVVMGNYVEAFFFVQQALSKRRELGIKDDIISSLNDIGILEQVQGRHDEAIEYYLEGLSMARTVDNKPAVVIFSANLSNIKRDQGEYGSALSMLEESEQIARELGTESLIAAVLVDLARTRLRLGDMPGARGAADEALELARATDNAPILAKALIVGVELLVREGKQVEATALSEEALSVAAGTAEHRLLLVAGLQAARAAGSVTELEQAIVEADSSGLSPLVTEARVALARNHLAARRPSDALREAEAAISVGSRLKQRDSIFEAHHVAARSLELQDKSVPAVEHYLAAITALNELRQGLDQDELRHLLTRSPTVSFGQHARRLLQTSGRAKDLGRLDSALGSDPQEIP